MHDTIIQLMSDDASRIEKTAVVLELPGIASSRKRMGLELSAATHPYFAHSFFKRFIDVWRAPVEHAKEFGILVEIFGAIGRFETHELRCVTTDEGPYASFSLDIGDRRTSAAKNLLVLSAPKTEITLHFGRDIPTPNAWKLLNGSGWNGVWILV